MAEKYWSGEVTKKSIALDLEEGVFTWKDPIKIAASLKKSAEVSTRRKASPFASAMSMLNFYINRAGKNLNPAQKEILEKAKHELRNLFSRHWQLFNRCIYFGYMKTVIHLKADKEVKENAQKAAADLGLTLSDVINSSLRNFIRTRQVVFSDTPQMTPELEKLLERVEDDIKKGRNLSPKFKSVEESIDWLKAKW